MAHRSNFRFGGRRRLVNLSFRPGLQLKLPVMLLLITAAFTGLFMAHSNAAYGTVFQIGLQEPWLRAIAEDIRHDYFVVSVSIAIAYAIVVLGACLAGAHRVLGPIIALERHLSSLKRGDYSSRTQIRAGHPLTGVARELNELSEILREAKTDSTAPKAVSGKIEIADRASKAVDRLLRVYKSGSSEEEGPEPHLALIAG